MVVHCFAPATPVSGRLPAIILLQEAFGVNPHIKRTGQRMADAGYIVFAPELFHRSGAGLEFGYDEFPKIKPIFSALTNAQMLEDLRVTFAHLEKSSEVDPVRIAVWGFCLGGWATMLAACNLPIAAALSFYGGGLVNPRPGIAFTPLLDQFGSIGCPVLLVYGGQDHGIPIEDIRTVDAKLTELGKDHEVEIYPDAGHGFCCEDRASYHRPSAEAAWTRAINWLKAKLN